MPSFRRISRVIPSVLRGSRSGLRSLGCVSICALSSTLVVVLGLIVFAIGATVSLGFAAALLLHLTLRI